MLKGERRRIYIALIVVALIILLAAAVYVLLYKGPDCSNESCFNERLTQCKQATYIKENTQNSLKYTVLGKKSESCVVKVKVLQIKEGSLDLSVLEGKEMTCELPYGVYMAPESDINLCHGLLKEEIQSVLIERIHAQLIENLGKIKAEIDVL